MNAKKTIISIAVLALLLLLGTYLWKGSKTNDKNLSNEDDQTQQVNSQSTLSDSIKLNSDNTIVDSTKVTGTHGTGSNTVNDVLGNSTNSSELLNTNLVKNKSKKSVKPNSANSSKSLNSIADRTQNTSKSNSVTRSSNDNSNGNQTNSNNTNKSGKKNPIYGMFGKLEITDGDLLFTDMNTNTKVLLEETPQNALLASMENLKKGASFSEKNLKTTLDMGILPFKDGSTVEYSDMQIENVRYLANGNLIEEVIISFPTHIDRQNKKYRVAPIRISKYKANQFLKAINKPSTYSDYRAVALPKLISYEINENGKATVIED